MFTNLFQGLPKIKTLSFLLLLIIVATVTYSNHFGNSFHFDDSHTIENNLFIKDTKNIPLFFKDGTTFSALPQNQSYRPIVSTSLALDYWMGHDYNLFYFHLSTFILFLLQGVLMFFMIFKIMDIAYKNDYNFYFAAAATSWYILHPANAETINYIIARSDVQSTFFVVLGFVLYMFSPLLKRTHLYLLPIGIGALAKPPAVMFAPMLLIYILFFEQQLSLFDVFKKANFNATWTVLKKTIPAFLFCAFMYLWVDHFTPKTWTSGGSSTLNFLITQPFVIVHYFSTFFIPLGLSADTDWQALDSIWHIQFFIGMAFIAVMIYLAFIFSKDARLRPISFGIVWFFLALIPSSSIIPFAEVLNDHRIFFPYVGLSISVCWTLGLTFLKFQKRYIQKAKIYNSIVLCSTLLLLSVYTYGTRLRNQVWHTEESLWKDVTVKSPKNARGLMNYGLSLMSRGDYKNAEIYFTDALKMWPYYSYLYVNMGVLKEATGDKVSAENNFRTATKYGPEQPDTWYFYGRFMCNQMRYNEAIPMLVKAIELAPAHIGSRNFLMYAYSEMGEFEKLNELAKKTLEIIPGSVEAANYVKLSENKKGQLEATEEEAKKSPTPDKYLNLSLMYYQKQNYEKCIEMAQEALKLKPDFAEAFNNIGSSYNMMKQYDKAIEACTKALELKPDFSLAKNNLNAALRDRDALILAEKTAQEKPSPESYLNLSLTYYQQAQYEKCIEACKNALKLKPDYADAFSNMGASYNQLKQWDKAIEACNAALKINPNHKLATGNLNWAKEEKAKIK